MMNNDDDDDDICVIGTGLITKQKEKKNEIIEYKY